MKIIGKLWSRKNKKNLRVLFILTGLTSTLWFLARVIPKPQRATYPCIRASAPVMSGFVIYLLSLSVSVIGFKKIWENLKARKYNLAFLFVLVLFVSLYIGMNSGLNNASASKIPAIDERKPNIPMGEARGIFPGRVCWTYMPGVAKWDEQNGHWWDDTNISQLGIEKMLKATLTSLTGQQDETKAWDTLFKYFNKTAKNVAKGFQSNEKIAIKINENNTYSHDNDDELNASPQSIFALLKSLIEKAGIPQESITVFDASRFITNNIFDKCHTAFPNVAFVDNVGGDGRIKSEYIDNAIPYSEDNGKLARGLATVAVNADYLINLALLKGHVGQGVTLCSKNYYGVTSIFNDWHLNAHNNFDQDRQGKPKYMTFVDFLGHKDLGEKTMLFLIDGLYGSRNVAGPPSPKWQMEPFNGNWACSLFASQDGVAIDAVGLDFLRYEWPDAPDMQYSENFLIEASNANNPPSGTFYDPERDKTKCKSLGVYEHWNNAKDKKYSRNLGLGNGIELVNNTVEL